MLKVKFRRIKNVVLMEVLKQDIRCEDEFLYCSSDGINIKSNRGPELRNDTIFIRGRLIAYDNSVASIEFNSIDKAKTYYQKCIRTIQDFNEFLKDTSCFSTEGEDEEEIIVG